MRSFIPFLSCLVCFGEFLALASPSPSIARVWNEEILAAIRIDLPHPPVHARNLFHLSVAMYDAWAAYDRVAVGYLYHGKHTAPEVAAARHEAISFAAYRILTERYALSRGAATTLKVLANRMAALGYDTNAVASDLTTPSGIGNAIAAQVSLFFMDDGALQSKSYKDLPAAEGGYTPVNAPLKVGLSGASPVDVNRWQPLSITNAISQNGLSIPTIQTFLGSQWLGVRPFALSRNDAALPWIDPGPHPQLGKTGDARLREEIVEIIRRSSELTPDDGVMIDIGPGKFGNSSLGTNDGTGHDVNPVTGLPYAPNTVKRGDFARVLAEFWADGPQSETPPGHWNSLANTVSDHPSFAKRLGGTGPLVDDLEWDVKLYFVLNAAVHDAACAAWSLKRYYDGARPITFIRTMGQLGQSSEPGIPSYHPNGLPLVPGLIELVTPITAQTGGRHAGLRVNAVAVLSWPGQPADPKRHRGVQWILAEDWVPYQKSTFVTPAFPGYISGHSTFSRAAAEVLAAITGSSFFPGGLGVYAARANSYLTFENGPSQTVELQWATYFDAADEAGLSRLWGGIHVPVDDLMGRRTGAACGRSAWSLARQYFDGSIALAPTSVAIRHLDSGRCELRYNTFRGFFYKLQSTPDLEHPFVDGSSGFFQAQDSSSVLVESLSVPRKFYRVLRALGP